MWLLISGITHTVTKSTLLLKSFQNVVGFYNVVWVTPNYVYFRLNTVENKKINKQSVENSETVNDNRYKKGIQRCHQICQNINVILATFFVISCCLIKNKIQTHTSDDKPWILLSHGNIFSASISMEQ